MTAHTPFDRTVPNQEAADLVVALQRCLNIFHALPESPAVLDGEAAAQRVLLRRYIEARRARAMLFGPNLFSDPAWDLLLLLFQAEMDGATITLEQLSETMRLSMNVTLGQVNVMERRGLLVFADNRRRTIRLTPLAIDAMSSWLSLSFDADREGKAGEAA